MKEKKKDQNVVLFTLARTSHFAAINYPSEGVEFCFEVPTIRTFYCLRPKVIWYRDRSRHAKQPCITAHQIIKFLKLLSRISP